MNQMIPLDTCRAAAKAAAGPSLTEQELSAAFDRIAQFKARLDAEGKTTGQAERLRRFAEGEAERTRIAAAMQRRHKAINILVRDRQERAVTEMIAQGLHPKKALLAIIEGTQAGVTGGRKSIAANKQAYEALYMGDLMARLDAEVPHIVGMLNDKKLDADIMAEMMEIKPGGKPGVTGNKDAQAVARIFSEIAERARVDLNKLGASIGKLEGWAGPQMHDDQRMLQAGKEAWVASVVTKLDVERTFSEGYEPEQVVDILGDIYDTIITGFSNQPNGASRGTGRVNPANLAKTLGASRVLHFKDAENARAYQQEFGIGNTVTGMIGHLRRSAQIGAAMEALGPNPQVMFDGLADSIKRRIKADPALSSPDKAKQVKAIDTQAGSLRTAMDIALGLHSRPENVTFAQIGSDIRAVQSMSKLGGAVITSIPSDTFSVALAAQFRGNNALGAVFTQLAGVLRGRPKEEAAQVSYLLGEGFDGITGRFASPLLANDGIRGSMAKWQEAFFRWNGLSGWTDVSRSVAARTIAAEFGMRAGTAFKDLPETFKDLIGRHAIDEVRWNAIRQSKLRNANGRNYITPDRIAALPDDVIAPVVQSRIDAAKGDPDKIASAIADGRRDLQLSLLRYVADETNYAVIKTDARTQRYMMLNKTQRPGSLSGEVIRFVGQFKAFPIAFTERVWGRALFGARKGAKMEQLAHIGTLIAGMTIAGYMAMVAKDVIRGYWPPRDPSDPRTWIAALQQGGAFGIYSDFLFSKTNRFGGGLAETLLGPSFGSAGDLLDIAMDARDAALSGGEDSFSGARAFSTISGMIPYANIYYVKPALDYVIMNSIRESLSPGYLRRQERNRMTEYGQQSFVPRTMGN